MLTPSKKIYYAIEAVLFIAYHAKATPVSGNVIAEAQGLPTRYLEPIMQKLVRAGILRGVRGPTGGYLLGRERRRISLADICATVTDTALPTCETTLGERVLRPAANTLISAWQQQLTTITIADLCEAASSAGISATPPTPADFTI